MIELAVAALVAGAAALAGVRYNLKAQRAWMKFADEQDLTLESAKGAIPRLRGERGGFEILVHGLGANNASVEIREVDPWFTFGPGNSRGFKSALGDPDFDAHVAVYGDRDFALGLLHHEVRRLAETIVLEDQCKVEFGMLHGILEDVRAAPERIERMLDLADMLRRPSSNDLPPLLARNALEDPAPGFRLLAFRQLATEFPRAPEAGATAEALLGDDLPEHRLEAARTLVSHDSQAGADAASVLEAIVELSALRSSLREQALDALARFGELGTAVRLATAILDADETPQLRRVAIEALVRREASEALMAVTPTQQPEELIVLAQGLGKIGDLRAQETLLSMLKRPHEDLQIAVAGALAAFGNAQAVPALRRAAASHPYPSSSEAKAVAEVVEDAVARIQHRLGGSQGGEVSITSVEPLEGAVSPAEEDEDESPGVPDGGEVSLAD